MKLSQIFTAHTIKIISITQSEYKHNLINMGLRRNAILYVEQQSHNKRYVSFLLSGTEYALKREVAELIEVEIIYDQK